MLRLISFWLQTVLLLVQSTPSAWSINCTLNFLFTTEKRLLNEHVWNDFFHSASSKAQYRVFIHNTMEGTMAPGHIESLPVEGTLLPGCSTQMSSIMQLLSSAAKLSAMGDAYLVLPADTVPVKTFTKTYMQFCSTSKGVVPNDMDRTIRTRRTTSSFCIAPYSQWIAKGSSSSESSKNTTTTTTSTTSSIANSLTNVKQVFGSWILPRGTAALTSTLATSLGSKTNGNSNSSSSSISSSNNGNGVDLMPRHDPWMHLNHAEVQKILSQRTDACSSDTTTSSSTGTAEDRVNWWFYQALNDPSLRLKVTEQEQGNCHTYYVTFNHSSSGSSSGNLNKIASTVNGSVVTTRWGIKLSPSTIVRTLDRAIMDPSVHLIADLIHSPHFFFARGFRGNEPGHHIVGMAQNYSIQSGFHLLQIFGNHQKKHHNRERGKGDNGGLKVLIVSCDDREMKDRLEDDDYVSMTAVLVHDYAMHHGYDFMKLTGNHIHPHSQSKR